MTKVFTTRGLAFWLTISLMVHLSLSAAILVRGEAQQAGDLRPFTINLDGQTAGVSGPEAALLGRSKSKMTRTAELLRVTTAPPATPQTLNALSTGTLPSDTVAIPNLADQPMKLPTDTASTTSGPIELPLSAAVADQPGLAAEETASSAGKNTSVSFGTEGSVAPPSHASGEDPVYPLQARINGWEGQVLLQLQVTAEGSVTQVTIARSSRYEELDLAAAGAVKRWKFHPARRNGTPVEATVRLPITFRLQTAE